jgi:hypothetical protein
MFYIANALARPSGLFGLDVLGVQGRHQFGDLIVGAMIYPVFWQSISRLYSEQPS